MNILQSSASRKFRDIPVKLTEGDMITLEAMGVSLFNLPEDQEARSKAIRENAGRDMIVGVWLATREKAGKRAAFADPAKARLDAFDWYEDTCKTLDGLEVFYDLLNDRREAAVVLDEVSGGDESGELPP